MKRFRGYDESWHEINIEELVRWLFDEKLILYDKEKETFALTSKGVFLYKFMSCYTGDAEVASKSQMKEAEKFHKFLSRYFDWSWLWKSVRKGDDIKK